MKKKHNIGNIDSVNVQSSLNGYKIKGNNDKVSFDIVDLIDNVILFNNNLCATDVYKRQVGCFNAFSDSVASSVRTRKIMVWSHGHLVENFFKSKNNQAIRCLSSLF